MRKIFLALVLMACPTIASAKDVTNTTTVTERTILRAGDFMFNDTLGLDQRVYVQVNIKTQMLYVFRGELLVGASSISSGKDGNDTPLGTFRILQKNKDHRSSIYDGAPMPYMMRLTWDGIALHAGKLPGYRASHGCVRLPMEFAEMLFGVIRGGDPVEVISESPSLELALR